MVIRGMEQYVLQLLLFSSVNRQLIHLFLNTNDTSHPSFNSNQKHICFQLILPQNTGSFTGRMRLSDQKNRILFIHATVIVEKGSAVRINITAPYWIINKTGLPLVFKQEGASSEFAGQFEENENGRMLTPLLFSFNDEEITGTLAVRLGKGLHPNGTPQWCQNFLLQPGVQVLLLTEIFTQ